MIDHSGRNDVRVFKEASALGAGLKGLKEILGSEVKAQAAVVYDIENRWALEDARGPRNENLYYQLCMSTKLSKNELKIQELSKKKNKNLNTHTHT